ncbi:MAG TPA: hypothetical protein VMT73_12595 [Anaerolineales bacterium]|nr:hypothetical protein [Anaerolineales bacterium]
MNNMKTIGIVVMVIGVLLLIVGLSANLFGGVPGFGIKQILATVGGVVIAVVGYVLYSRK